MVTSNTENGLSSSSRAAVENHDALLREYLPVCVALVTHYQDEHAAQVVHDLCHPRLTSFARSRIYSRLAQRIDPEDVVQDTFSSFFAGLKRNCFQIDTSSELWNTLLAICSNKILTQSQYHSRQRRSIHAEEKHDDYGSGMGRIANSIVRKDSPVNVSTAISRLRSIVGPIEPRKHEILLDSLGGASNEEIAKSRGCSERSVRRILHGIRRRLEEAGREERTT